MKKYQVLLLTKNPMYPNSDMELEFFFETEETAVDFVNLVEKIELQRVFHLDTGVFVDSIYYKLKNISPVEVPDEEVDTTLWIQFLKTIGIKFEIISGGDLCVV